MQFCLTRNGTFNGVEDTIIGYEATLSEHMPHLAFAAKVGLGCNSSHILL